MHPLVFSGPSGSGKSTLIKRLFKDFPNAFGFSISHTTRSPRPGEQNGVDYHFVSRETMDSLIKQGAFIEWAQFSSNWYGTSFEAVKNVQDSGRICILDIDLQGVKAIKLAPQFDARFIFIKPPCLDSLRRRLIDRNTETEESLTQRLETAAHELDFAERNPGFHHLELVNDNLDLTYKALCEFIFQSNDQKLAD